MNMRSSRKGFATVTGALILVVVAALVIGAFWLVQKRNNKDTPTDTSTTMSNTQSTKPNGTTQNLENSLLQSSSDENQISNSASAQATTNAQDANSAVNNIGGAANAQ